MAEGRTVYGNNCIHRIDGPAIIGRSQRQKLWLQNHNFCRNDGPAFMDSWCIEPDNTLDPEELIIWAETHGIDPHDLSEEDILVMNLRFR